MLRRSILTAHSNLLKAAATPDGVYSPGFFPSDIHNANACAAVSFRNQKQQLEQQVRLEELVEGKVHTGCVLQGVLQVKPCRMSNVAVSVLEDDSGKLARLMAFNTLLWNSSQADVERMYPDGAQVRLRDPLLQNITCLGSSMEVLWVSNPMALEIVSYFPTVGVTDPQVYLNWGTNEAASGNTLAAVDLSTRCIECCDGEQKVVMVEAFARRAEAWLARGSYAKALGDAEKGLSLDSLHARCLLVKGLALCSSRQYEESYECLKLAKDGAKGSDSNLEKLIEDAYSDAERFKQQSREGKYDLSEYYLGRCREEAASALAEYVGPVKIQPMSDEKGRGLFLTKSVNKGDILIVSNAVALVLPDDNWKAVPKEEFENEVERTLYILVLRACMESRTTLAQVLSLAEYDKQNKKMITKKQVPSMDLYTGKLEIQEEDMEFDISRIFNCIHPEWNFAKDTLVSRDFCGLWALPSFLNHSCLPNVSLHRVGKAMLVVAAQDMEAGTELLRCYEGAFVPWKSRLQKSDIVKCECQRCQFEGTMEDAIGDITQRYQSAGKNVGLLSQVALELEQKLMTLPISDEQKDWLRASYLRAYMGYYNIFSQFEGIHEHEFMPSAEDVMRALHRTAPGYSSTLKMMCWLYKLGSGSDAKKKLLYDECVARCGRLEAAPFQAIVKDTMRKIASSPISV